MYLIVGLGNPGRKYEGTRHNVGFMVVQTVAKGMDIRKQWEEGEAWLQAGELNGNEVVLIQPLTYMNDSGRAVSRLVEQFQPRLSELLVILDDINLPLGSIRVRRQGSDGGHHGLASIICHLATEAFPRMRLGIGPDTPVAELTDFVLTPFTARERERVGAMVEQAGRATGVFVAEGIEKTMNTYNTVIN